MRGQGKGRVYPRGNQFWIGYYGPKEGGEWGEIREWGGDTEDAAKKLLKARIIGVTNDQQGIRRFQGPAQEKILFGDLLDALKVEYQTAGIKSLQTQLWLVERVRAVFGQLRAIAVTSDRIRAHVAQRQQQGKKNATINRELEIIRRAFRLAIAEGKLAQIPRIVELKEDNARQGFFEPGELEQVLVHLEEPLDDLVRLAYLSGWRRGELMTLTWENVDRGAGEIRIFTSKNGDGRVLPMDPAIAEIIERRWQAREYRDRIGQTGISRFVFHRNGKLFSSTPMWKAWNAACEKAGFPGRLLHDLRRTGVRDMIRAGVSQHVAMSISGHRTDSMFRRYNITSTADKLEALRRRSEYVGQKPASSNVVAMRRAE